MYTHGSLFAGIGGFDLGFERAGFKTVWQVEIDGFCDQVLHKHWPMARRFRDVRECGAGNLEAVDVISGGFPCQDISVIGKQVGIDGERSGLWSEMRRILCELRPRFAVMENVAALTFRGLERVLGDLAEIGFDAEWHCVPAAYVGLPHYRDRIWIIANAAEERVGSRPGNATFRNEATFTMPPQCDRIPDWKYVLGQFRGVDDGLSGRAHRDRGKVLGNAIVPQIAEVIAERIKAQLSQDSAPGQTER